MQGMNWNKKNAGWWISVHRQQAPKQQRVLLQLLLEWKWMDRVEKKEGKQKVRQHWHRTTLFWANKAITLPPSLPRSRPGSKRKHKLQTANCKKGDKLSANTQTHTFFTITEASAKLPSSLRQCLMIVMVTELALKMKAAAAAADLP